MDISSLQRLFLLRLSIEQCPGFAPALLTPGSLPTLQRFQFKENLEYTFTYLTGLDEGKYSPDEVAQPIAQPQVKELGCVIFGHASRVKLSGQSRILFLEMPQNWQKLSTYKMKSLLNPLYLGQVWGRKTLA